MTKDTKGTLPSYLKELLHPTPSCAAKLIAAWDGLSLETHIQILTALEEVHFPSYLAQKVLRKAIDSSNVYVRYLAAKQSYLNLEFSLDDNKEERALKDRVELDSDPLVKYCLLENEMNFLDHEVKNPESFFSLPQEARLAKVRQLSGSGEAVASLIAYAADNYLEQGKVSEIELYEILVDYLNKPSFQEHYGENYWWSRYDGAGEFSAGKDIEALWALIPKLPESISHVLIEHLPEAAGLSSGIPKNIIEQFTPRQLGTLLYRKDIVLEEFRQKIFKQPAERLDIVRCAAISCNFDLSYDDFSELLSKPDSEKIDTLRDLVMAGDLSLVFYEALYDILSNVDNSLSGAWEDAGMAEMSFEQKAKSLTGWQRKKQIRELRLYRLAKQAVPWKTTEEGCPPTEKLEFLTALSVKGDTWTTFNNFSNEWAKRWNSEGLERFLPRIYEVGEEDVEESFDNNIDNDESIADRVGKRVVDVIASISKDDEGKDNSLMEALGKLTAHTTAFQGIVSESIGNLKSEINQLRTIVDRQKVLLYIVIGLLVVLLILKY